MSISTIKTPIRTVYDGSNNPLGLAEFQVGEVVPIASGGTSADSVSNAKINLQLTDANIRSLFSVSGGGSYNNTNGIISIDATDLTPFAKTIDLTTANVVEQTNLYYTNARVGAYINESITTTDVSEGDGLYFTFDRARSALVSNSISIGELTVTGNLTVQGDTVQLNTATLTVEDKNIILANGSVSAEVSNGAGITVAGADATITYLSDGDKWQFNKNANVQGNLAATGTITSPFFYSESDIALKENVQPINNALGKVLNMFGVSFNWKSNKTKSIGVIAQDIERVVPEIVSITNGHKTVSYDSIIPILIEAIKEQQKQIDELKKKIND